MKDPRNTNAGYRPQRGATAFLRLLYAAGVALLCTAVSPCAWAWQAAETEPVVTIDEGVRRFFDQEEFDEIILNDENHTSVRVQPISLPKRRPIDPTSFKKGQKLIVRQVEDPTEDYEVKWGDIAEIKLFEYVVLGMARDLVRQGKDDPAKFDEAYDYFDFLKQTHPNVEGLSAAVADYLYEDAGHWHRLEKYENALGLLNELYALDPTYAKLPAALGATTQKLIEPYLAADDYAGARRVLGRLAKKFPQSSVVTKFQEQWANEARQLIAKGREQIASGAARQAWETAQRVLYVWPRSTDAAKFFEEIYAAWPRIVVGVTLPWPPAEQPRLGNWATRRDGRLLHRLLVEFTGTGAEGGQYVCPFGQVERTDIGRRLIFRLKRDIKSSTDGTRLTGFDVARQLLALGDPQQPGFEPTWADLFGGVSVQDVYQVDTELRWSYVQPLALLETPVAPLKAGAAPSAIGPYVLAETKPGETHFLASTSYFAAEPGQPKEVVELHLANSADCWSALERGKVQLIDRLAPWEVERYRANREFVVGQYALPTLHCLAPNMERPFMQHRCYRRALAYGINRELVLKHHLLRDQPLAGCQLITGPFPIGNGFDDPLRYAYNSQVEARERNPRLAIALSQVALHDLSEAAKKRGDPEIKDFPKIVLAHPAGDIAREVCKGIKRHIEAMKFSVELRELPAGITVPTDKEYDLLFLEITAQEPLVDGARLLGPDGLLGQASPYMTLALVQLAKATNWQEARQILQRIHQITVDDVAIIPLWQMPEHFAYHRSMKGIDQKPVLLYQSIERWRGTVRVPAEE
ncbi:MAG TPA: ABC transporter substrate-binding protein [Pirellulales bacterium]|nr:ABC transporter substrate-binding protein [Pirellulales bacterium]